MTHYMSADAFLRAMMRDVAWGFFYYQVNFDTVFGTNNLYGKVEMFAGSFNESYKSAGINLTETFDTPVIMETFKAILDDWCNEGFDPFSAPEETGNTWMGAKHGENRKAINRNRETCVRMVGLPGDAPMRSDANGYPINRAFHDVPQDKPEVHVEPGFEKEIGAVNLFAFLSRSDVTWNPSITSVVQDEPLLPDDRGIHPADQARQRPRRMVHPALGRDQVGGRGQGDGKAARQGDHEGGRRRGHAGRYPPSRLQLEAVDAARVGERQPRHRPDARGRRDPALSRRVLIAASGAA